MALITKESIKRHFDSQMIVPRILNEETLCDKGDPEALKRKEELRKQWSSIWEDRLRMESNDEV